MFDCRIGDNDSDDGNDGVPVPGLPGDVPSPTEYDSAAAGVAAADTVAYQRQKGDHHAVAIAAPSQIQFLVRQQFHTFR